MNSLLIKIMINYKYLNLFFFDWIIQKFIYMIRNIFIRLEIIYRIFYDKDNK